MFYGVRGFLVRGFLVREDRVINLLSDFMPGAKIRRFTEGSCKINKKGAEFVAGHRLKWPFLKKMNKLRAGNPFFVNRIFSI